MKITISDLWNGNIAPVEHCGAYDDQANERIRQLELERDTLIHGLTETQRDALQKYIDNSESYWLHMMELSFCDGFSLGAKLMLEVFH